MSENGSRREALDDLQGFLDDITEGMNGVERWAMFPGRVHRGETVTMHSLQSVFLAAIMLGLERRHNPERAARIHGEQLLVLAGFHDTGEGLGGDVRWTLKQHRILGPMLEHVEHDLFLDAIIRPLPEEIRDTFLRAYELQEHREDNPTGRFFWAIEILGYMLRAWNEYLHGGMDLALDIFWGQKERIEQFAKEYASVRIIYGHIRERIEAARATPEGQAVRAKMQWRHDHLERSSIEDALRILSALDDATCAAMLAALQQRLGGDGGGDTRTVDASVDAPERSD